MPKSDNLDEGGLNPEFRSRKKVKCPIIAYTAYRHMLWIADRDFEEADNAGTYQLVQFQVENYIVLAQIVRFLTDKIVVHEDNLGHY